MRFLSGKGLPVSFASLVQTNRCVFVRHHNCLVLPLTVGVVRGAWWVAPLPTANWQLATAAVYGTSAYDRILCAKYILVCMTRVRCQLAIF